MGIMCTWVKLLTDLEIWALNCIKMRLANCVGTLSFPVRLKNGTNGDTEAALTVVQ